MARRQRLTPEEAARKPGYIGRFMAWLGFGPEAEEDEPPERGAERGADRAEEAAHRAEASRQTIGAEAEAAAIAAAEAQRAALDEEPIAAPEAQRDAPAQPAARNEVVSLSTAGLDDLLALGMSATQAKRVLDYRERMEGFDSLDDLDQLPGFPRDFLDEVKQRLTL